MLLEAFEKVATPVSNALFKRGGWRIVAVLLFFFVSGACGLLYQVVWTRRLVLLLGAASYAVSTVLSVFFTGLAFGSLAGGRLADRTRRPLAWYGLFEILIGLWAVVFILAAGRSEHLVGPLLGSAAHTYALRIAVRAGLAAVFLLGPVCLMGATLPLLARYVTKSMASEGLRIGSLYSVNTFGAVAGCAAAGFWLLPGFGYAQSTYIGAAANVAIGLLALLISRQETLERPVAARTADAAESTGSETTAARALSWIVLIAYAVSGFCALALEVLWTRLLTVIFLGTTYAFTTMLTALLCGIAAGSGIAAAFADRVKRLAPLLFGAVQILAGAACIGMLAGFAGLPQRLQQMQLDGGYHWEAIVQAKFVLSFAVLFVPMFLLGMTFPFVVRSVASTGPRLGRDLGRLYFANTFGGVLGAAAGGYLLIPVLGTHTGIVAMAVTLAAAGALVMLASPFPRWPYRVVFILLCCGTVGFAHFRAPKDIQRDLNAGYLPKDHKVIHYREGVEGAVVVSESTGRASQESSASERVLWINAMQATASIQKGVRMNRFEGVLPMLFDRDPRTALFMCFGSGITASTLGLFDYERVDAVELSRDVLEAAPLFASENFNVTRNPKFNFIVDDGRNFLLSTPNRYDLITFEPMPLAQAGVSTFYTREYYELCLEHLNPGGLVSQWVPLHSLDPDIVRSLIHTFTTVFPDYCAWFINADIFIIGSNQPLRIDYDRAAARLERPEVAAALRHTGFPDPMEFVASYFMGKDKIDAYSKNGTLMTDDRPWAEFEAPKLIYASTVDASLKELIPYYESPAPRVIPGVGGDAVLQSLDKRHRAKAELLEGLKAYYGGIGGEPEKNFKKALEIDPKDGNARYFLIEVTQARLKRFEQWKEWDNAVAAARDTLACLPGEPAILLALADIQTAMGANEEAKATYQEYLRAGGTAIHAKERAGTQ